MAFRELVEGLAKTYPHGTTDRYRRLDALERLRDGTIYDHLAYPFSQERNGKDYLLMADRRPAVIYKLVSIVVNQCASLLFGDSHAPTIRCWRKPAVTQAPDPAAKPAKKAVKPAADPVKSEDANEQKYERLEQQAELIIDILDLDALLMEAVVEGSVGSCAIIIRPVGKDRFPYLEIVPAKNYRPVYDIMNPLDLVGLVQGYPTTGQDLLDVGYEVDELLEPKQKPEDFDPNADFWMRIELDKRAERRFLPLTAARYQRLGQRDAITQLPVRWELDTKRSANHTWGIVPAIDIRQLKKRGIDGECSYQGVLDICVEIDYLLSQIGRGVRYSADPLLAIARGELASQNITGPIGESALRGGDGGLAKTAANVIELENGAKAELLEITGQGLKTAGEHISKLREYALEVLSGMKSESEHSGGVQSGKAMDKLWEAIKLLVMRLRIPYGNQGLIPLMRLLFIGLKNGTIVLPDVEIDALDHEAPMRNIWPQTALPQGAELLAMANAVTLLAGASRAEGVRILDQDTLTRYAAGSLGMSDPNSAVKQREVDDAKDDAEAQVAAEQAHTQAKELVAAKPAPPAGPPQK